MPERLIKWKQASYEQHLESFEIKKDDNGYIILTKYFLPSIKAYSRLEYHISPNGTLLVTNKLDFKGEPFGNEIPRVGTSFQLKSLFDYVEWYGRGPHENYIDRKESAFMGYYTKRISEMKFEYARPQENGTRIDTKKLILKDDIGNGIIFEGLPKFSFSIQTYKEIQLLLMVFLVSCFMSHKNSKTYVRTTINTLIKAISAILSWFEARAFTTLNPMIKKR